MCEYANFTEGKCRISNEICPYLYFCNKTRSYKELKAMPSDCRVKEKSETPKGYYKVEFERRHRLYVLVDNKIEIVPNPYDHTPLYVKMTKLKSGKWKIKQAVG